MTPTGARLLEAMPGTAAELGERACLSAAAVYRVLEDVRREGRSHVASWREVPEGKRGRIAAVHAPGAGEDAPKPAPTKKTHNRPPEERRKAARPFGSQTAALQAAFFSGGRP